MLNEIVNGVVQKLNAIFEDAVAIYTEETKQDLKAPCFFVTVLEVKQKKMIGNRYYQENPLCIQFFPSSNGSKIQELYTVSDILFDHMDEVIMEDGSMLRGTQMKQEVSEGRLLFKINYNLFVVKELKKEETMNSITINEIGG